MTYLCASYVQPGYGTMGRICHILMQTNTLLGELCGGMCLIAKCTYRVSCWFFYNYFVPFIVHHPTTIYKNKHNYKNGCFSIFLFIIADEIVFEHMSEPLLTAPLHLKIICWVLPFGSHAFKILAV